MPYGPAGCPGGVGVGPLTCEEETGGLPASVEAAADEVDIDDTVDGMGSMP